MFFSLYSLPSNANTRTIVINCGHSQGYDSGAVSKYIQEADLNHALSARIVRMLNAKGYRAYITHTTDEDLLPYSLITPEEANTLRNVGPACNATNPDLALSIHHNSGGRYDSGYQFYWSSYRDYDTDGVYTVKDLWRPGQDGYRDTTPCGQAQQSLRLANILKTTMAGFPNLPYDGTFERDDYLPAHAVCPCILYEGGFLSNPSEASFLATEGYLNEASFRIVRAIDLFFEGEVMTSGLSISAPSRTISMGSQLQFSTVQAPAGQNDPVTWSSDDESIVTVDGNGVVTGINPGTTTIRAHLSQNDRIGDARVITVQPPDAINVSYSAHIQDYGWRDQYLNGETAGTVGESKRLEAFACRLLDANGNPIDPNRLGVVYRSHVEKQGWQDYTGNGNLSGSEGQGLRLEAVRMKLTGTESGNYDLYYRTHCEQVGWTAWTKNNGPSGTEGHSLRMEAIEIQLLPKGSNALDTSGVPFHSVYAGSLLRYSAHIADVGNTDFVPDQAIAGGENTGHQIEALRFMLDENLPEGDILCASHVENEGWRDYTSTDQISGTIGESKRLECVKIKLTGQLGEEYNVYYQVFVAGQGWSDLKSNDQEAGTTGTGLPLEAIRIWLSKK